MSEITVDQISLNSVSKASTDGSGNWVNDFTGNDIAFAHTTEETNRKSFSTQPELNDGELVAAAAALEAAEAAAQEDGGEEGQGDNSNDNGNDNGNGQEVTPEVQNQEDNGGGS